jgi:Bacterial Ig domain
VAIMKETGMGSTRRGALTALLAVATVLVSIFAAGSAGAYPPGTAPTLSLSSSTVGPGGSVTSSGNNFVPGSSVTVTLDNGTTLATLTADANGAFSASITIPAGTAAGDHTLTATDATGESATAALTVTAAGAGGGAGGGGGGGLANTGVAIASIGGVGLLLLIGGGLMLLAGRRRSKVTAA